MDVNLFGIFVTVAIAHFLALLSPGPDFVLVVKSAIRNEGKNAIGVALGIASANALYIGLCLIGVGSILAASVTVMIVLKVIGGLFLIYLAVQALRASKSSYENLDIAEHSHSNKIKATFFKEFITGFMSGILNPKNLLFYLSLFTVVLTPDVGLAFKLGLGIWMTAIVFLWDLSIIFLLSTPKVRSKFTKLAYYIDKVTGAILGIIGFAIVKSALAKQ
ncbi:LysE family translocator [Paraglaciecola polaris]|uniref:Threonine efflux protein n=1 Tax=Paraglaciecola polaris LMG 21857 TaxID=1129793 RepID=K7AJR9_9ALTE|nr:LysE family transporter [Paraglaciecola polaris]GAC35580.1 threonine efflux protein [Paraglaciecola polaris LMG 21857]|tara:strand:+ start:2685 stop:3341 length:657 start_codon:yes stop_codon:yes gene_type:complete